MLRRCYFLQMGFHTLISRICGHCGIHAHMALSGPVNIRHDPYSSEVLVEQAVKCNACERLSIVRSEVFPGTDAYGVSPLLNASAFWDESGVDTCIPSSSVPEIRNLPPAVEKAAADAFNCFQSDLHRPAVLMARTTIEATAKASGVTSGTLVQKIDALYSGGLILESTKSAAHAIRTFGNEMAHGDLDTEVSPEDTRDIIELMHLLLREVFELPDRAGKLQARAEARKVARDEKSADVTD